MSTELRATLVDESSGTGSQDYTLTQIHKVRGHVVRIRIRRDSYQQQSWAVAEVLAAGLTWTELASAHPSTWFDLTPSPYAGKSQASALYHLASQLHARAALILAAHEG